jgi:hypothetical protein
MIPIRTARRLAFAAFFDALRAAFASYSKSLPSLRSSPSNEASEGSSPPDRFALLRAALQDLEQVVTSSQQFSHFLRHVNGRLHTTQVFTGKL